MNLPTRLSEVDVTKDDIDGLIEKLEQHGMTQLGEHSDITPKVSRTIFEKAL
jgi:NADP-dependent alcohol dehydrogenase